jgi:heat shock protein HtpX
MRLNIQRGYSELISMSYFVRTATLLGILFAVFLLIGWFVSGIAGATAMFFVALLLNIATFWFSDKIVLAIYRAKPLENARLNGIIAELADKAEIPRPKTYIVNTEVPNAFATGRSPKHAAVAVTKGLIDKLSEHEIRGVLGHELYHIKHRDTLIATMAATIAGAISWLAYALVWGGTGNDNRGGGSSAIALLIFILAPLSATLIQLAISRSREYHADQGGALITNPLWLASALEKIESIASNFRMKGNPSTAHLWIVNPFRAGNFVNLFSTHPPTTERVRRLKAM